MKITLNKLLYILLIVAFFCSRPMIFGNVFSIVGMSIGIILVIYSAMVANYGNLIIQYKAKKAFNSYICYIAFAVYIMLQSIFFSPEKLLDGLKNGLQMIIVASFLYFALSHSDVQKKFIKLIYIILISFAFSYMLSFILVIIFGWEKIILGTFNYGYFVDAVISFPFTVTYGSITLHGIKFGRLLGICRESGMTQIFYIWAFFMADKYFKNVHFPRIMLFLGLCFCLSTAGFIVFAIAAICYLNIKDILSWKTIIIILIIGLMTYLLLFSNGLSLAAKAADSLRDRIDAIKMGTQLFIKRPLLGYGYYYEPRKDLQMNICLLSSIGQIGIVGVALFISTFLTGISRENMHRYIYSNIALFVTALLSQPIMTAPAILWFLFCDYSNEKDYLF